MRTQKADVAIETGNRTRVESRFCLNRWPRGGKLKVEVIIIAYPFEYIDGAAEEAFKVAGTDRAGKTKKRHFVLCKSSLSLSGFPFLYINTKPRILRRSGEAKAVLLCTIRAPK